MSGPSPEVPPLEKPSEQRLDSWKEIAAYLNRDVSTAQRWERREGMPVHRHLHDKRGSVYALSTELDAWMLGRNDRNGEQSARNDAAGDIQQGLRQPPSTFTRWVVLLAVAVFLLALVVGRWLQRKEAFWRNPIASAPFRTLADFDRIQGAAAISRDGQFVAFLSDRDGQTDIWVTQVGSGEFHNLTHGSVRSLLNPSVRTLGFSPDGSLVTFWTGLPAGSAKSVGVWAVPTLGGEAKPFLDGAEYDFSPDGSRLAYHPASSGDPLFVSDANQRTSDRSLFSAAAGVHCHFPLFSQDGKYVYFVMGVPPNEWDIWRISTLGGNPERITSLSSRILYPVLLNEHTLLYLASDSDGGGPWLYSIDVNRRIPHRLTYGIEKYTSLAATANGRRIVMTLARPKTSLWHMTLSDSSKQPPVPSPMPIPTSNGFFPRIGPDYLLYVSSAGSNESIWKLAGGTETELWKSEDAHLLGSPAISTDGNEVAFAIQQKGKSVLYVMKADGTGLRIVSDSLDLRGAPAWTPNGAAITIAANDHGTPHLYRISVDGKSTVSLIQEYSTDPVWARDGSYVIYSGPDVGTRFPVKAATVDGGAHFQPHLVLVRGSRNIAVLPGGRGFAYLNGEIQHKDLWLLDPETGAEHQLTKLPPDFNVSDFDISRDGREVIFERTEESSQIVLVDLAGN
jgi:Tol biopolymer transport system component